jgi:hypothetical protein
VTGVVRVGAVTARLTAVADDRGDEAGAKIAQAEELLKESGTVGPESAEQIWHGGSVVLDVKDTLRITV